MAHNVLQHLIDDVLLKNSKIAIRQQILLQRLQFEAELIRNIANAQLAEIRQAGLWTNGRKPIHPRTERCIQSRCIQFREVAFAMFDFTAEW